PPADRPERSRPDPGPSCPERAPLAWADRFGEAGAAMRIETTHRVDHPHRDVVDWHERPGALIRLTPPGLATPADPAEGGTPPAHLAARAPDPARVARRPGPHRPPRSHRRPAAAPAQPPRTAGREAAPQRAALPCQPAA